MVPVGRVGLYQLTSGAIVAIKSLEDDSFSIDGLDPRIVKEISILQSLRGCDNLLQLLGVELLYDAQEEIAKVNLMVTNHTSDLRSFIKLIPLTERLKYANEVVEQLLNGLFQLYQRGIIHRDIKPDNIFLDYDYDLTSQLVAGVPHCYYGDFGHAIQLACNINDRAESLETWIYTVMYRPPELMVGRRDYTEKADLWALGATLVEYFSGETLFSFTSDSPDHAIRTVLPQLANPPPDTQYDQYIEQLKQGTIHTHVLVEQFLMDKLGRQIDSIPKQTLALLNQMLQVNPDDRPSIATLVVNQSVCPRPPTLLPRPTGAKH